LLEPFPANWLSSESDCILYIKVSTGAGVVVTRDVVVVVLNVIGVVDAVLLLSGVLALLFVGVLVLLFVGVLVLLFAEDLVLLLVVALVPDFVESLVDFVLFVLFVLLVFLLFLEVGSSSASVITEPSESVAVVLFFVVVLFFDVDLV